MTVSFNKMSVKTSSSSLAGSTREDACISDHVIIGRVLKGNAREFEQLVYRYETLLFGYLMKVLGNREEAEDILQETFLKALNRLETFDTNRPFKPWLFRIATNLVFDRKRKKHQQCSLDEVQEHEGERLSSEDPSPRDVLENKQREELLAGVLKTLPQETQVMMALHYQQGFTINQIAEQLDKKPGAIKVALHRTREKIRTLLKEKGKRSVS